MGSPATGNLGDLGDLDPGTTDPFCRAGQPLRSWPMTERDRTSIGPTECDVLIVGAGLAGLTAARELRRRGLDVLVVDKGRSVGGRLATRRIGSARLDHGAQFFTVRGPDFDTVVGEAIHDGVVHEWCRGFAEPADGYPRFVGTEGMNAVAKWLASDVPTRTSCEVGHVESSAEGWACGDVDGRPVARGRGLLLTAPVPQSLALLDRSGLALPSALDGHLRAIAYFATLALLVTVDGATAIPQPGGLQLDDDSPFTFIGDNQRKGVSPAPALTFHANHAFSAERYDDDPAAVLESLLTLALPWLGSATVLEAQLKKWRYAGPVMPVPEPTIVAAIDGAPLAFAGDAFGGPKVEGAFNSGLAAGHAMADLVLP